MKRTSSIAWILSFLLHGVVWTGSLRQILPLHPPLPLLQDRWIEVVGIDRDSRKEKTAAQAKTVHTDPSPRGRSVPVASVAFQNKETPAAFDGTKKNFRIGAEKKSLTLGYITAHGNAEPQYPQEALDRGWEAELLVELRIDARGQVTSWRWLSTGKQKIFLEAVEAVLPTWRLPTDAEQGIYHLPIRFRVETAG